MKRDREIWALALHVERCHGDGAMDHVASKIEAARIAGERVGVQLWEEVERRMVKLGH